MWEETHDIHSIGAVLDVGVKKITLLEIELSRPVVKCETKYSLAPHKMFP
jgi:hypothetical protein